MRTLSRPAPFGRIRLGLAAALLAAGCGGGEGAARSVLLVTLDTTRADVFGCTGADDVATPNLDRLAREGVVYEVARTVAPLTLPAHASILTGLYPPRHGVRANGANPLPQSAVTLAELAQEAGIQTAAFVGAVVLDGSFGLEQGFDVYDSPADELEASSRHYTERPAWEVIGGALAWLDARDRDRPFFLWVHLFDPHMPYEPPFELRSSEQHPYLGEVAGVDRELGRLWRKLDEEGLFAETFVAVVSDHGEALGEHDELSHSGFCYDSTIRVPLILRHRDGARAGERSRAIVSVVDLLPTLAGAMGFGVPPGLDGIDLLAGAPPADRGVYFESYYGWMSYGWSPLAGWADGQGKYLHSSEPELFDVTADPGELRDLAPARADQLERYRARIAELYSKPALEREDSAGDAELAANIRALGYASIDPSAVELPNPLEPTDRPSPKSRAREQLDLQLALEAGARGEVDEAFEILDRIVAENPNNYEAIDHRTFCLMRLGRHEEALDPLRRVLRESPGRIESANYLAACLLATDRLEEARDTVAGVLAVSPADARAISIMADVQQRLGNEDEAAALRKRLEELLGG